MSNKENELKVKLYDLSEAHEQTIQFNNYFFGNLGQILELDPQEQLTADQFLEKIVALKEKADGVDAGEDPEDKAEAKEEK